MADLTARTRERLVRSGQAHALAHLERLAAPQAAALADALERLDLDLLSTLRALLGEPVGPASAPRTSLEPCEVFPLRRTAAEVELARRASARGSECLARGQVGFVLVAGGQASRLGYEGPKGCFPVGPVSGRSLFEIHARRIRRAHGPRARPPWFVMTSPANDAATRAYFEEERYFGLAREDVFFFAQDVLPALDEAGRLLFAAPGQLFLAPNGHGGVLLGLQRSGALDESARRGVRILSYFQVDNPLARSLDPLFLGLHDLAGAGMSSKVVRKRDEREKVGVIGRVDGALGCIEYSDLPAELRAARDARGALCFDAGNIAVHALSVDFVRSVTSGASRLPWHLARKKMQVVDERGSVRETMGVKFESFVFDALARSERSVTLEVERAAEFSPVKNQSGEDSPESVRRDQCALFARWARAAHLELPPPDAAGVHAIEIDPLFADSQEEFVARALAGGRRARPEVRYGGHLYDAGA
jgi:UDP-N-acetylglucosamine/UDP-N-acetylgalactosamine diphosphorylase